jgi:tetratricopeptide (TPR) repeat protein
VWQLIIFVLALILRLLYLFQLKSNDPLFYFPIMDALYHHEWAVSIVEGSWLGKDSFFRAPLYPYFLASLYKIFGINLLVPRIIQSIFGSVSCVFISKIGTLLFKKRVGILAGIIACFYPLFIYFDNELLIPPVLILLCLLGCYLLMKQEPTTVSRPNWFFIGIIWGLTAITRPNVLLFLAVLPFWLFKHMKKKAITAILYGLFGVMVMVVPVTVRNYVVSQEFVPIAWQGGINFYIGNNPNSDGVTAVIPGTRKTWWGGFYDAKRLAEESLNKKLKNSEIDTYWFKQGVEFITEEPLRAFGLLLKKAYLFFGGFEFSNNRDIYFFTRLTYLKYLLFHIPLLQFPFGLIFPLCLTGIIIFFSKSASKLYEDKKRFDIILLLLFIASYSLSFIFFFVCARFRVVIIPLCIIFSSFTIFFVIEKIRERQFRGCIIPLVVFIASCVVFNANFFHARESNPAASYLSLGVAYKQSGRIKEALETYHKAIESDPTLPEGYFNIGNIYAEMGRLEEAKKLFLKAIDVDPSSARAHNNLGNIYLEYGDYDMALAYYRRAIALEPDYVTPLYHSGLIYAKRGDYARAESLWIKVLRINPGHWQAQQALEVLRHDK